MGRLANWKPLEQAVQPELLMQDGTTNKPNEASYLSGAYTMLAAGPPRLAQMGGASGAASIAAGSDFAYPIGILQGVNLGQSKAWSRFFELGSQRSYFVAGRTMGQIQLNRVMYHGPSLLRMLYAYYQDPVPESDPLFRPMFDNPAITLNSAFKDIKVPPGYENIFLNLASDLFDQPVGLLFYMRDTEENTVAMMYAEACTVTNHTWGVDAMSLVVQEGGSLQYERLVPVSSPNLVGTLVQSAGA